MHHPLPLIANKHVAHTTVILSEGVVIGVRKHDGGQTVVEIVSNVDELEVHICTHPSADPVCPQEPGSVKVVMDGLRNRDVSTYPRGY